MDLPWVEVDEREAAEEASRAKPERAIPLPAHALSPEQVRTIRQRAASGGQTDKDEREAVREIQRVHHRRAEAVQRARSALGGVLWACALVRAYPQRLGELARELTQALDAFGWPRGARVPMGALDRRQLCEAWGTARWWALCDQLCPRPDRTKVEEARP